MRCPLRLAVTLIFAIHASAAVTEIASPAGVDAAQPFLSSSKKGLLLSWVQPIPNSDRVALRFARLSAGKWSEPRTIVERNDLFVNWADFPSIVEDTKGVLFAHWLQKSGSAVYAYDIRMLTSADGGKTWSEPFLLNRDGKQSEHGFVSLAPLSNGGVGATWLDGRNMVAGKEEGEMTVRYATVDARGAIRSDVQLDDRTCECCTTGMAMTSAGPVIVYRDRSSDEIRDIAFVRRIGSHWTKPRDVHRDGWKIAGCPVNGPQVAATGRHVVVAWFTAAHEQQRVSLAFSNDGAGTFAAPVVVDDGKPVGRVDVVLLDGATAFVTWIESTATGVEIRGRVVSRNLPRRPSIKVAASSSARGWIPARDAHRQGSVRRVDRHQQWPEACASRARKFLTPGADVAVNAKVPRRRVWNAATRRLLVDFAE